MPCTCVRGARGRFGGVGPVPGVVSSPSPPSRPACPALCVVGRPVRVSLALARWYAIPCGLCVPRARSSCPSGIPPVSFVCVCARAPAASALPPLLPRLVWSAHFTRSRCWALVEPFPSALPAAVPCSVWFVLFLFSLFVPFGGGAPGPVSPLPGVGVCAPRGVGLRVRGVPALGVGVGWVGRPVCRSLSLCSRGASGAGGRLASVRPSAFPGQATKRVFWTSLWQWRAWPPYRSGSCSLAVFGRGPCGALGFACPSRFLQAAGAWRRALLQPPSQAPMSCWGEGGSLPLPRGGCGPASPWLAGPWGGCGDRGRSRRGSPPPSLGGAARGPLLSPQLVAGASLPGVRVRPGSWGSLPPAGQPGGQGGAVCEPPLRGGGQGAGGPGGRVASVRPSALPWRAILRASPATLGPWGRGPHTAPVRCGAPPPGVARALVLRGAAGLPACRDSRGGRQWGVRGRAACRSGCVPLPGVTVLSGGGGTPPRPRGG